MVLKMVQGAAGQAEDKIVTGAGDGVRPIIVDQLKLSPRPRKRIQVPSAVKFNAARARNSPELQERLKKAIEELSAPKKNAETLTPSKKVPKLHPHVNLTRQKAMTVAEITPSRNFKSKKMTHRGVSNASSTRRSCAGDAGKREIAAHRVYQQLLLNAWRRRRRDVETLNDSCQKLTHQVNQLEIQKDVLQKLRESESKRRSESFCASLSLQQKIDELENANKILREELKDCEMSKRLVVDNSKTLKMDYDKLKNKLSEAEDAVQERDDKLHQQKKKLSEMKKLKEESEKKVLELYEIITDKTTTNHNLENNIANLKQDIKLSSEELKCMKLELERLEQKLRKESDEKLECQERLRREQLKVEKAKTKMGEMKRVISSVKESKNKLAVDNMALVQKVETLLENIRQENAVPWWKNAGKFLVSSITSSAFIMLPALPKNMNPKSEETESQTSEYLKYL